MRPEDVGLNKTDLVLGKHSGRAALADRARQLGYTITSEQLKPIFEQFKRLADEKKEVYDGDLAALIEREIGAGAESPWTLAEYKVSGSLDQGIKLLVKLQRGAESSSHEVKQAAGPVDAAFAAINELIGLSMVCREFRARNLGAGERTRIEVHIDAEENGQLVGGRGESTDLVQATVLAVLNCANRLQLARRAFVTPTNLAS
jgi:2-isopropylmalate synthase